eukprot:TRINITY_DN4524_c0_g1_i2.p1 TRINITY_DN4524_c0_g1~~TRINITY_DN4524_c0_g1_i2.p1  ORF type:complete len:104 (-),score=29.23 TRINITY_DN4524_c0_g1_i2:138-449(-)
MEPDRSTALTVGIADVRISSKVQLMFAGLTYSVSPTQLSTTFGAEVKLSVFLGQDSLMFTGSMYLKQVKASSLIGFSCALSGIYLQAFGILSLIHISEPTRPY